MSDGLIHKALIATPDSPAVLDSLGWVRFREGDAKGAVPELEHAYSLEHDADIAAHWGEALWMSGDHAEARRVWAAALARDPDSKALKATIKRFLPDAEGGRLPVADANLDIVQSAGIAGGKGEIESRILVGGDASRSEAAAEEADSVGEKRALDEA